MVDIKAMFMQIKVSPDHRDVLTFLCFKNYNTHGSLVAYRVTSHLFGGVWSPSCANYALRGMAREFQNKHPDEVRETVHWSFYVNDCLKSKDSMEETVCLATHLLDVLARKGFNLTKWVSNELDLLKAIPQEHRGNSLADLDVSIDSLPNERALGMLWKIHTDTFEFDAEAPDNPRTNRGVLNTLGPLYDPFGLVSPFILRAHHIYQQLC